MSAFNGIYFAAAGDIHGDHALLKEPTYFRKPQVEQLLAAGRVAILMTHDWPTGHFGPFGFWIRPTTAIIRYLSSFVLRPYGSNKE